MKSCGIGIDGEGPGLSRDSLARKIDAAAVPVLDLDAGLRFYHDGPGHHLRWRNDDLGQAALAMPGSDIEIVLSTQLKYEAGGLVTSADEAAAAIAAAGGRG